jgi:hypothetical protein
VHRAAPPLCAPRALEHQSVIYAMRSSIRIAVSDYASEDYRVRVEIAKLADR